ncbi:myosin-2-like isoform X1 [Solanum stenotomum]|uniref:myosin-2-like isoform X1 n=1 Tax=Solanum stenotomum TaxID=172797 RepID=UPI0020D17774|nr:myosin-2-like isoform X1 [Solanum stenotomum]
MSTIVRSSLEEMLDSLRQRDENEKPKDLPPALPARPKLTSRTRPPSQRQPLSKRLSKVDVELENGKKKEESKGLKRNVFGAIKVKGMEDSESPYAMPSVKKNSTGRLREVSGGKVEKWRSEAEWDDRLDYFVKKKLRIWCRLRNGAWVSGHIQSTSGEKAMVLLSDGSVVTVPVGEVLPANPDVLEGVDDLMQLSYLNEPSVLHNLHNRYARDMIYSKAGPALIAINPFKDIELYGNEFVTAYRQKLLNDPHVYSIADTAYDQMMEDEISQSIIISGESGSGKTETAKFAMEYLAMLGGGNNGIEKEVLQTSYILEAFGNAKTSRNNNSSRFGKLIEIHFSTAGRICGAKIQTLILEKSRVVQLLDGERSYHIFYQLCAGAPPTLRDKLKLKGASEYKYLNQSGCLVIHDVDDAEEFCKLMEALNTVRISERDQEHAFQMIASVLWLGNITFQVIDDESHVEVVQSEAVTNAASLIGCTVNDLILALSTCQIQAGKDKIARSLTVEQATDRRDALAKFIYANLFDWIVDQMNRNLAMDKEQMGRSINILDIYGFESFKRNTFEQFLINYANERLQQHVNRHLLKLEQEEYELDGIDWSKVDFEDNQECLNLFEKKPIGLISLLNEESNSLKATDLTFACKLKQHIKSSPCFKIEREEFCIRHYAGEVTYDATGFLAKNRDVLHPDIIQLLSSSDSHLPEEKKFSIPSTDTRVLDFKKQSVATKFKDNLFELMQQLENTIPHFICCIKPNNKQLPGMSDKDLVIEQLRCCGVLEVVRISRSGYPTRLTHQEFTSRYGFLLPKDNACQDPLSMSVAILHQFGILPELYQVGYTKLYFRSGQIASLEDVRNQVLQGTLEVQKCFRGHRARRHFHELKGGVIILQSFIRGEIERRLYNTKVMSKGLVMSKGKVAREGSDEQLVAVVQIQSAIRGWLARRDLRKLQNSKMLNVDKRRSGRKTEVKELPREILPSVVEDLERRVAKAEATIEQKEKENAALKEQANQFEARCLEYEVKMRSMEEMWQKQMTSLQQASLAAAKNTLAAGDTTGRPGKLEGSPSPHYYDSDDATSMDTPAGRTPINFSNNSLGVVANREVNGGLSLISHLTMEFEQRKQNFDNEAMAIVHLKPGQLHSTNNPADEYRRLKHRFEEWKKEYKVRLKETKSKVHKLVHSKAGKSHRKWWGKKSK